MTPDLKQRIDKNQIYFSERHFKAEFIVDRNRKAFDTGTVLRVSSIIATTTEMEQDLKKFGGGRYRFDSGRKNSRCSWPLGRILEVHTNRRDGLVRSVKVKTSLSVLIQPVDKIIFLESEADPVNDK